MAAYSVKTCSARVGVLLLEEGLEFIKLDYRASKIYTNVQSAIDTCLIDVLVDRVTFAVLYALCLPK